MAIAPHPEDIKAELRKRYGSVAEFERRQNLPSRSVKDVLRGKARTRIAQAIAKAVGVKPHKLFPDRFSPNGDTINRRGRMAHRQSGAAK